MEIKNVGVVGCGQMGSGIVEVCARAGYEVTVCEAEQALLNKGLERIERSLAKAVSRGKLDEAGKQAALGRISGSTDLNDLAGQDIVIEAVFEDLSVKQALFGKLDAICKPNAILASNTSSIAIAEIAAATKRGGQVIGIHFFNPAPVMKLVEVVPSVLTGPETTAAVREFGASLGKTTVLAKDSPGFIVNRLLVAFLIDAIRAYEQGLASREDIDTAVKLGAGHPMGPLTLCDFIGLDVIKDVADIFFEEYGEPRFKAPPLLTRMVAAGQLGRKSGQGFYEYGQ